MSSPIVTYLLLDSQYDPVFIPQVSLTAAQAVAQNILTRLNLWAGEWWENLNLGLPVFQSILGQSASKRGQAAMSLAIQQQIQGTQYVTSVTNVNFSFANGQFSFTCTAQTVFGQVTVSFAPGQSASLGS